MYSAWIKIDLLLYAVYGGGVMQIYAFVLVFLCLHFFLHSAQLAGAVQCADCISAEEWEPCPTSVLDMTLNNMMVRLQ